MFVALSMLLTLGSSAPAGSGNVNQQGAAHADRFAEIPGVRSLSGRLIVRPLSLSARMRSLGNRGAARDLDRRARARLSTQVAGRVEATDEYLVRVPPTQTDEGYARSLLATGDYQYVEPDWLLSPARTPDDPLAPLQWHHARILAPGAWDTTVGAPSVVCAVCDTGVDLTHPDLAPVLVEGGVAMGLGPVVAQSEGGDVSDVNGHGTLVAGCIGAVGNNGIGVAGCGWSLALMPVRVSSEPDGTAFLSDITKGARWAVEQGARVVNCSYEGVSSDSVQTTGEYVESMGGLLFWAAGNYAQDWTTFDHDDVVVVGATTDTDERAAFSAFGPGLDLFAPGVGVYTTQTGGGYEPADGTSFSCAIASGVAALVWSRSEALTPGEVEQILFASCDDLGEPGNDDEWGWGRVNAWEAVLRAEPPAGPPGPFQLVAPADQSTGISVTPRLQWSESAEAGYYRIVLDDDPMFGSPEIDSATLAPLLDVELGQLAFETTYQWTVVAQNLLGSETFIPQVASFTTGPLPLPASFSLLSPGPGAIGVPTGPVLTWGASYLSDSYRVVVSAEAGFSTLVVDETVPAAQTALAVPEGTLAYGHAYHWSVTATNAAGERSTDPGAFATAPPPPPGSFSLLAPVNGAVDVPQGATLAWTASSNTEQYIVEVDVSPTFPLPVATRIVPAPEIVAVLEQTALDPLTVYYWRVRAINGVGEQISSPTVSAFSTAAPPPPACAGDINADGSTDVFDFIDLVRAFGTPSGASRAEGDLNGDGAVDALDFGIFATDFGCQG